MSQMSNPTGKCTVVKAEQRKDGTLAVFVRVFVKDEAGQDFYFDAACFNFDLRKRSRNETTENAS
jgi:hypothetical protein